MLLKHFTAQLQRQQQLHYISLKQFSRAEILKSLDKSKVSRKQFIKKELTENPEFFKAFPHLQTMFNIDEEEGIKENPKYYDDKQVAFKDKDTVYPYFESLLHHHNQYMAPKEKEEAVRENERNFVEGYENPMGPFKWLSKEQIESVHSQVDIKMQELEESGLTREEILYNEQKGIPLNDDPFFQFVKSSRSAREMLIKPGEEFTMEKVIEKALRQDIGPDPTIAMNRVNYKYDDEKNSMAPIWEYKKKYRDRDPVLNPEAYFYDYKMLDRRQRQFDFDQEKPATFINRPLSRSQIRKKFMRKIRKSDITWRDTVLLSKFMNETGKILNRYQSRLQTSVQKKVAKTIKQVRDLNLFSHVGLVKPTDKIPVGSFIEDLEEMHKKTIDPLTGRMFLKHSLQESLPSKEQRIKEATEQRFAHVESKEKYGEDLQAETQERVIREMSLDNEKLIPDRLQRQWMVAQAHIVDRDDLLKEQELNAKYDDKEYIRPNVEFIGAKEAYEETMQKLKNNEPSPENIFDQFITEKSLEVHKFEGQFDKTGIKQLKEKAAVKPARETEDTEYNIRQRIESIMGKYGGYKVSRRSKHKFENENQWKIKHEARDQVAEVETPSKHNIAGFGAQQ